MAEVFKRLNSTRSADARAKIEQGLWEQLRSHMPTRLAAAWEPKAADGTTGAWGIDPADAISDAHKARVSAYGGSIADKVYTWPDSISWDLTVDCDRNATAVARSRNGAAVQFFSQEQQKAAMKPPPPDSGLASALGLLCTAPMRLMPIWVVDNLTWIDVGGAFQAAPAIRYRDPGADGIWYLFVRNRFSPANGDGAVVLYYWLGVNCHTHESEWGHFLSADSAGKLVYLHGIADKWVKPQTSSAAANSEVIVCDQGADY